MLHKPLRAFFYVGLYQHPRKYSKKVNLVNKILEPVTDYNQIHVLEDIITPLARTPYEKQLQIKRAFAAELLKAWKKSNLISKNNLTFYPFSPSPVLEHYRSKDEFNVRKGIDGDPKTFGFFSGKPDEGEIYAIRPTNLINVKPKHKRVLQVFEDFVKKSPLPPCYRLNDGGYWRRLVIRSNLKGDLMVVAVVHPQRRSQEEIADEKEQLVQHFLDNDIRLHSLYHQQCTHVRCSADNSCLSLIYGSPYIYEEFLGRTFRISPDSFFQINVKAAEVLHNELLALAKLKDTTTLLDVCCGVGTFSVICSNLIRNCVGVEQNRSSIEDALANLALNKVSNCSFTLGSVETSLNAIYDLCNTSTQMTVIVNPGRSGLHPRAVALLREHPAINKILYISCDPGHSNTQANFAVLLNKKKCRGDAFTLTAIKPVDLFPHTYHYEMILMFERS